MKNVIGIDLGTTNTVAAVAGDVAEGTDSGIFLPSVVAFLPNGKRTVGRLARRRLAIDPTNTIASAKRLIGRKFGSADSSKFQSRYPYELVEGEAGLASIQTRAGAISPSEVSAFVVGKKIADMDVLPGTVQAIVTVPTMFREAQTEATRVACKLAGIKEVHTVLEPLAAAHAYLHKQPSSGVFAIYDLGGGTFDMAIVRNSEAGLEVLASSGDLYLGGDDIDHDLANRVAERVLRDQRWDLKTSTDAYTRLVDACEKAKIRLAYSPTTEIDLGQVDPSAPLSERSVTLDAGMLDAASSGLIGRTFVICDEVLHRAGIRANKVNEVFLAGGSTQLELVRQGVSAYFGKQPRCDHDPMEVIAIGSSLMAKDRWLGK